MPISQLAGMLSLRCCATVLAAVGLGSLLTGCGTGGDGAYRNPSYPVTTGGPAGSSVSEGSQFSKDVSNFFLGQTGPDANANAGGTEDFDCPSIDIRPGASTLTLPPGSGGAGAAALRYQVTIAQMARSCTSVGGTAKLKVGVQGRIILGPAGGPGKLDIPLRYAVVHEGPEPKTIVTKFYKVPVTVPDGQQNVTFMHIDDTITYPAPKVDDIDAYVVYVGFDSAGDKKPAPPPKKPVAKPAPKRAPAR